MKSWTLSDDRAAFDEESITLEEQKGRMAVTVLIPTPLRQYVGGANAVQVEAASIAELLDRLSGEHTALRSISSRRTGGYAASSTCT